MSAIFGAPESRRARDIFIAFKSPPGVHAEQGNLIDSQSGDTASRLEAELREQFCLESFYYIRDVVSGANFLPAILRAVEEVKAVICLVSDSFFTSHYCRMEINEAKRLGKLYVFSTQRGFDPSRYSELVGVNVPELVDWNGTFAHPELAAAIIQIAKDMDRPALPPLIRLHRDRAGVAPSLFDDDLVAWCDNWPNDPAATKILQRIFRSRLEHRLRSNEQSQQRLSVVSLNVGLNAKNALERETAFLRGLSEKAAQQSPTSSISAQDVIDLRAKDLFDASLLGHEEASHALLRTAQQERDAALKLAAELKAEVEKFSSHASTLATTNMTLSKLLAEKDSALTIATRVIEQQKGQFAKVGSAESPDVFISYKREERSHILAIVRRLEALKLRVWFDAEMRSGTSFDMEIDQKIRSARVVLVCWSPDAVRSDWVRGEATIGRERGVLAAAKCKHCVLPAPFNMIHTNDLTAEIGPYNAEWLELLGRIATLTGRPGLPSFETLETLNDKQLYKLWVAENSNDPLVDVVVERLEAL